MCNYRSFYCVNHCRFYPAVITKAICNILAFNCSSDEITFRGGLKTHFFLCGGEEFSVYLKYSFFICYIC